MVGMTDGRMTESNKPLLHTHSIQESFSKKIVIINSSEMLWLLQMTMIRPASCHVAWLSHASMKKCGWCPNQNRGGSQTKRFVLTYICVRWNVALERSWWFQNLRSKCYSRCASIQERKFPDQYWWKVMESSTWMHLMDTQRARKLVLFNFGLFFIFLFVIRFWSPYLSIAFLALDSEKSSQSSLKSEPFWTLASSNLSCSSYQSMVGFCEALLE